MHHTWEGLRVDWRHGWKALLLIIAVFAACYWLPVGWTRFATR